jgi:hypothetical protein
VEIVFNFDQDNEGRMPSGGVEPQFSSFKGFLPGIIMKGGVITGLQVLSL